MEGVVSCQRDEVEVLKKRIRRNVEYCITTSRPSPEYTEKSTASSTVSLVDVSVKIGDESFELDQTKIKKIGSQQETPKDFLARKVLRHLRKRDEEAGTTKVTLN